MTKKKILWSLWSFSLGGGAEKILASIVNYLQPRGYDNHILEIDHFDKGFPPLDPQVTVLPPLQIKGGSRLKEALVWRLRHWVPGLIRRHLVKEDYDIEVSFTVMNPPMPFSQRPGVTKIAWIHGSVEGYLAPDQAKNRANYARYLATADYIIAISQKTKESIIQVFPDQADKIRLVYNGYDFQTLWQQAQAPTDVRLQPQSFVVIGRIEALKGSPRILDLVEQLHRLGHDYHAYFLGSGELEASLKDQVRARGLSRWVHFLGYQTNPYPILKQADCLVSMSLQEGFPGVFVESLALGVPFVSTDVGGARELAVQPQFGQVIETDAEAIAAIKDYLEGTLVTDTKASQDFISQFTIPKQGAVIQQLFDGRLDH